MSVFFEVLRYGCKKERRTLSTPHMLHLNSSKLHQISLVMAGGKSCKVSRTNSKSEDESIKEQQ